MANLGRLEKVELRKVWSSESGDFTPWLAKDENLALLGESIGLELELESTEKAVGRFSADIHCKDTASGSWVIIENQLERTDHTHLGQLITYAAGLDAVSIVWVAERFTEEHRAAMDWLNEHTDEKINFFGLEVELWKIGASSIAPKFNVVSKPNEWARNVQRVVEGEMSETKQQQLRFWQAFREYMEENSNVSCQKASPQHWMNHSVGRSGFHLASIISTWNSATNSKGGEIRVELVLNDTNAKANFEALAAQRSKIEEKLKMALTWHNPEDKNMCRVYVRKDSDFSDESQWPNQHLWLKENLEAFHSTFSPLVREL